MGGIHQDCLPRGAASPSREIFGFWAADIHENEPGDVEHPVATRTPVYCRRMMRLVFEHRRKAQVATGASATLDRNDHRDPAALEQKLVRIEQAPWNTACEGVPSLPPSSCNGLVRFAIRRSEFEKCTDMSRRRVDGHLGALPRAARWGAATGSVAFPPDRLRQQVRRQLIRSHARPSPGVDTSHRPGRPALRQLWMVTPSSDVAGASRALTAGMPTAATVAAACRASSRQVRPRSRLVDCRSTP
jgi:hypothetical protein